MHWLTYHIYKALKMSLFLLTTFAVNHSIESSHAVDEWRRRLSACVDTEGGHSEHCL